MLRIKNKLISTPIIDILYQVRRETDYLKDIKPAGNSIMFTCPFHSNHNERHPSCGIVANDDSPSLGLYHCFTCGEKGFITKLIGTCFEADEAFGEEWLLERYADIYITKDIELPKIELDKKPETEYLDESILDKYSCYHPYMQKRKLTPEVLRKFKIGYDKEEDSLTFPCWDSEGHLIAINRRSVTGKNFKLASGINKAVYLLNFIKAENITKVAITESQINALTLHSWGYPAVALMGTGTKEQYEILKNSGIRDYLLCFDGDLAGDKGIQRFMRNMNKDVFIHIKKIPRGKDVNDLTKEEFDALEVI